MNANQKITNETLLQALEKYKENEILPPFNTYLRNALGKDNPHFFNTIATHYLVKLASLCQARVSDGSGDSLTVNAYTLCILPSGFGKSRTVSLLKNKLFHSSSELFEEVLHPAVSALGHQRYIESVILKNNLEDPETLSQGIISHLGTIGFVSQEFDSFTAPGFKQRRNKAGVDGCGSINVEIDEIGQHITDNEELFKVLFEVSEDGRINNKGTKNTKDTLKEIRFKGSVPTNLLAFGEPSKLFDYDSSFEVFHQLLQSGFARRFIYVYDVEGSKTLLDHSNVDGWLDNIDETKSENLEILKTISENADNVINSVNIGLKVEISKKALKLHRLYMGDTLIRGDSLPEYEGMLSAQLKSRPFIAIKIAAAYAMYQMEEEIAEKHYTWAMSLLEVSGEHFVKMLNRPPKYVHLANFITEYPEPLVETTLMEKLKYYKGSAANRKELMTLARIHAINNGSMIRQYTINDIQYTEGSVLEETNINELILSVSKDLATGYKAYDSLKFSSLVKLLKKPDIHEFTVHRFKEGHRTADNAKKGFNLVVLDVDEGTSIDIVKFLLQDFVNIIYTTKSNTAEKNRFRIILPIKYKLHLNKDEYKGFMNSIYDWLFFSVDTATNDISRKWSTNPTCIEDGFYENMSEKTELLDPLKFIVGTQEEVTQKKLMKDNKDLDRLSSWFVREIHKNNNRNSMLFRYIKVLLEVHTQQTETGPVADFSKIKEKALALNNSLQDPLGKTEVEGILTKVLNN